MRPVIIRVLRCLAPLLATPVIFLYFFQSRMIYFPQPSPSATISEFESRGGKRLDYVTSQGNQTAWLLPAEGNREPERFCIVCAGNASQALSLSELQNWSGLKKDAFLLVKAEDEHRQHKPSCGHRGQNRRTPENHKAQSFQHSFDFNLTSPRLQHDRIQSRN